MAYIQERKSGETLYRVSIRLKGYPTATAIFERKTDAMKWAKRTEVQIRKGLLNK